MSSINVFEFFGAAGNATNDGVFLPVATLTGVNAAELADAEPGHLKLGKAVLGMMEKIYSTLSPTAFNKLGFTVSRANPTGAGNNLINQNFGATAQKLLNFNTPIRSGWFQSRQLALMLVWEVSQLQISFLALLSLLPLVPLQVRVL
jgi:hypothetical protein